MDVQELERYGYSLLKRKEEIAEKLKKPDMFFPMEIMGKQSKLACITVRIELPVYRLANGRTRSSQLEYLSTHPEAPKDLFTKDHDAFEAQRVQHELLKELVKEEDLLESFQSGEREQTEPIICTDTGVVVNGNRRLCAWRELYYKDKVKYKSFETISIAVLVGCDEKAISDIEKRLQIQKTMRAEYHWHTKALMAEEDLAKGYKEQDVAKSYDLTKKQLRTLIEARQFAAQYLKSKGYENQWSRVDKKYYAFESIVNGRKKISNPHEQELFEKLVFDLISESTDEVADKPSGRLYTTIKEYADNIHAISADLYKKYNPEDSDGDSKSTEDNHTQEEKPEEEPANEPESTPDDDDDDLGLLTGGEAVEIDKASVVSKAMDDGTTTPDLHSTIKSTIDTQKELQNEKDKALFLVHKLAKIAGDIQNAISIGMVDNASVDGVEQHLQTIRDRVDQIQKWVDEKK